MFKSIRTIICLSTLVLFGCSKKVEQSEIIGLYVADFGSGTNCLAVRSDGTYVHSFFPVGKAGVKVTNKWEFEYWRGKPLITFYEYAADPIAVPNSDAFWPAEVIRSRGRLLLSTDSDVRRNFVKR